MSPTDLRSIRTFPSLVKYLRDELDWPIETEDFDDLTFDYRPEELGIDPKTAARIEEIKQLRPLVSNQPWGIFFIKFEPKKLPVVVLRRILRTLVIKKRASASQSHQATWNLHDLLFISSYGESDHRDITFAHFTESAEMGDLPALRVLGWDDEDTVLHLEHAHKVLREKLRWPGDPHQSVGWGEQWSSAFTLRHREVITTSRDLAIQLARLATAIRKRVSKVLSIETESGPLHRLMKSFKKALIHDLYEEAFADMYAQTITYGLLSARVSRPAGLIADNIADMVPITNPFLRELLSTFLTVGGRKGNIDFDELGINEVVHALRDANMEAILRDFGDRNPQEDPVIHFYELFLKEYNPKLRMQRGVFYTPRPVVSFIVRSVDEILRTEFGLEDGLADITTWGEMLKRLPEIKLPKDTDPEEPFVQILDPALGTGTFLVEVIDVIHKTMTQKWQKAGHPSKSQQELWNEYVPKHLLLRLYGFELLMAPYAIAHMKIGLKLWETGYRFGSNERAHIYLTNSLEPPSDIQPDITDLLPGLAKEAQTVNEVKRQKRFTIIIGNPPYSHLSSNLTPQAMAIVEPYKFVQGQRIQERGALSLQKNLQDDYIKFVRIAEEAIEKSTLGVVGLITNNSYLDSRSFRGMRFHLSQTFNMGWILDLHGSGKKNERLTDGSGRDVNVFDIIQGVAISLWIRPIVPSGEHIFCRADILGPRQNKYAYLGLHSIQNMQWKSLQLTAPFYPFVHQDLSRLQEYERFISLKEVFPVYLSGIKTHRDFFSYSFTENEMIEKLNEFCSQSIADEQLRKQYGLKDTNVWRLRIQRRSVSVNHLKQQLRTCIYRPFDNRWTCFSDDIIELTRRAVMNQMLDGQNLALLCSQQQAEEGFYHCFCTRQISDCQAVSNRTRESTYVFPLWIHKAARKSLTQTNFDLRHNPQPNVATEVLKGVGSPAKMFSYVYALLYSPSYRSCYATFLRTDFPRLPLTSSLDLFHELSKLGDELVSLHLMESPKLDNYIIKFVDDNNPEVEKVSYSDGTVWIDKAQTTGFKGVPEYV